MKDGIAAPAFLALLGLAFAISGCGSPPPTKEPEPAWKTNRESLLANPPAGMRLIKGGRFRMGGLDQPYDSLAEAQALIDSGPKSNLGLQLPSHEVELGDFYMDTAEVSEKEWRSLMGTPPDTSLGDDMPVSRVNWVQAILFCNRKSRASGLDTVYRYSGFEINTLTFGDGTQAPDTVGAALVVDMTANGYRLPTEAEFEYAARAGTDSRYPWGNEEDTSEGWWAAPGRPGNPRPVASKPPNAWGIHDLIGNVGEWVNDGYFDETYYGLSPLRNPFGPEDGRRRGSSVLSGDDQDSAGIYPADCEYRIYRGGDLRQRNWRLTTPRSRLWIDPSQNFAGFRTVLQVR